MPGMEYGERHTAVPGGPHNRCVPIMMRRFSGRNLLLGGLTTGALMAAGLLFWKYDPANPDTNTDEEGVELAEHTGVSFNRDIRPILAAHCFSCHGPDLKKAGLDLQVRESALKTLKSGGAAVVPGRAADSRILQKVTAEDDERMPPANKGRRLTDTEIAKLRTWIDAGATWEKHWAYVKPERSRLPRVKNRAWVRTDLDRFVLARLERAGLSPSPEAAKPTLLRRVSLDLTGLPPTLAELDAFLADTSPDAYEKAVERLLDSRHYGEHQARYWLDQARYADSNGYEKDERRSIWPYRDWVITAFNRDLPFDQFTTEQLAGDLLPNPTQEQRVATGFHRNTMVNTEGGVDDEEFRIAAIVDRVNTTMDVWMGSTLGCAQCHNHKYDPFSQKEYYRLFAFFNSTEDRGTKLTTTLPVLGAKERPVWEKLDAEIARLQSLLDTPTPELAASQMKWEAHGAGKDTAWIVLNIAEMKSAQGTQLVRQADGSVLATGPSPDTETYTLSAASDLKGITAFRLEVLPDNSLPEKGPGRHDGDFVLTEFQVTSGGQPVSLWNPSADISLTYNPIEAALDNDPSTGWSVAPQLGLAHVAVFETVPDTGLPGGTVFTFTLKQTSGENATIGRFRLSATASPRPLRATHPTGVAGILALPREKRTPAQQDELSRYYRSIAPELNATRAQQTSLRKKQAALEKVTTLVMRELPRPRATHVLLRGNHKRPDPEQPVEPGVPAVWHSFPTNAPANRLGLARWLVHPDNPLVGRVVMNRLWARYFGRGLVETSEDFGARGEAPTHPELLDWLAAEFAERKWSLKAMHRQMVTSATYRQSSRVTPDLLERDPYNRLYARSARLRLDAEAIRDNTLAACGLLNRHVGGPSVFPYQPDGVASNPYSVELWQTDTDGNQYRRGLYTFWRRTAPYASFGPFDAPSREVTCDRRPRSNTPLAALTVLNDRVYVEAAVALGRRMLSEVEGSPENKARHGFRLSLARLPTDPELRHLVALYQASVASFRKDKAAAAALLKEGSAAEAKGLDPAEWAAWTLVANVLLNLDEMLTKE